MHNAPIANHAIKRQDMTNPSQTLREGSLFDTASAWIHTPASAFDAWIAGQFADSTVVVYRAMFNNFLNYLAKHRIPLHMLDEKGTLILAFLNSSEPDSPLSAHRAQKTRQREQYLRLLRRVYAHLGELGVLTTNPGQQAKFKNQERGQDKPTRFLTQEEREAVIGAVASRLDELRKEEAGIERWIEFRDLALIGAILGGGLKVSHVERVTLNCMELQNSRIELSGRRYTHRARLLPFALAPLQAWMVLQQRMHAGTVLPDEHPVFEADRQYGFGRFSKTLHMHASSIHRRTQRFLQAAGVTGERASAQTLRNTYAAIWIDQGATDEELVDFLGLHAVLTAQRLRATYFHSLRQSSGAGTSPTIPVSERIDHDA